MIEWVNEIKYLGVKVNDKKLMTGLRTYNAIKFIGLEIRVMDPKMKAHMFKCYVRPIIYYGLENIYLFKTEIKKIQSLESQIVKKMLGQNQLIYYTGSA
jgi:hypothetical protein